MFYVREVAGWALMVLGLWLFYQSYSLLMNRMIIQSGTNRPDGDRRVPGRDPPTQGGSGGDGSASRPRPSRGRRPADRSRSGRNGGDRGAGPKIGRRR